MKRGAHLLLGLAVGVGVTQERGAFALARAGKTTGVSAAVHVAPQGRNGISGHVFGESRAPIADIIVELLDELDVTIDRSKTTSTGRYAFSGLSEGRFKVKVLPYGTDYAMQVQEVVVSNISAIGGGTGGEILQRDFYLRIRAEANAGPFAAPGTVFAQEVPDEARKLYEKGVVELRAKKEKEGFESLKMALDLFPEYYLALDRLGTEYATRGNVNPAYFEAARLLLTKSVSVNRNSFSSSFGLGFSQYHLGMTDQAVENLQRAVKLYDKSINGHLWLGVALKKKTRLAEAEAALARASKLSGGKAAEVQKRLAEVYSAQKNYGEAAAALELYLKNQKDARDAEQIRQLIKQLKEKAGVATKK